MSDELDNVSGADVIHELRRRNPESESLGLLDDALLYTSTPEQIDEKILAGRNKSNDYEEEQSL